MKLRWAVGLFVAILTLPGCAHRSLVCTFVKIDGEPAIMCADADVVKGQDIRPYQPAPSPSKPSIGPYWRYDEWDRHQKETRE